jgi:hypothetical protein
MAGLARTAAMAKVESAARKWCLRVMVGAELIESLMEKNIPLAGRPV